MNEKLIEEFCLGFFGYGNLNGEYWFVGMEEGGENSVSVFYENYVEKWDGKESTDILVGINTEAKEKYFGDNSKIQKTWGGIIRLILSIEGNTIDKENILNFQKNSLGRIIGNNLLLELLPLPNKSTANWDYQSIKLPHFDTRKNYRKYYLPERIRRIKELIAKYNPKVVVFYSVTYMKFWKEIMGIDKNVSIKPPFIQKINNTTFVVCKHPAAHGITNEYYPEIGNKIRNYY